MQQEKEDMIGDTHTTRGRVAYKKAGTFRAIWLIARRQMLEAIRDRSTLTTAGFLLVMQTVLVLVALAPDMRDPSAQGLKNAGFMMAFYLLVVGLMPSATAIGIASGAFAGDKERGSLLPLLVTPASNTAIFAGKVLGAILPALLYSVLGMLIYFLEIIWRFGVERLGLLPATLSALIVLLIPAIVFFGAALASVISSRVRTFQAAQNFSGFLQLVLWFGLGALFFLVGNLGLWAFTVAVAGIYTLDVVLIIVSAMTWQREEVMANQ